MTGGFLDRRPVQPLGLGLIVGAHVLVLVALALSVQTITQPPPGTITIRSIPAPTPPPVKDKPLPFKPHEQQKTTITRPPVIVDSHPDTTFPTDLPVQPPVQPTDTVGTTTERIDVGPVAPPRPASSLINATVDSRYANDLQPPYPAALQRSGTEGMVTVRVRIGTDGRVREVQQISASDPLFFAATERQALKRWRFRPATRDGMPEESWITETVRFRLDEL